MKRSGILLFVLAGLPLSGAIGQHLIPGYPELVTAYDSREIALLPKYCKYTQSFRESVPGGNNKEEIDRWYLSMGPAFHAMHHYCWGLMKTHRALMLARTRQIRNFYLDDAIGEYDYVLRSSTEDFAMVPEILMRRGQNLIWLGKGPLGVLDLERAISLKADYWPVYAALSDYYKSIGDYAKARERLDAALKIAPDVKGLIVRRSELDAAQAKPKGKQPPLTKAN